MRGSTPQKRQTHSKISQKQPKIIQNYLYIYTYIYLYFYGFALASSRRVPRTRRETRAGKPVETQKHARWDWREKHLLDRLDASRKRISRSSASPKNICMYIWSVREATNKKVSLCDIRRDERAKK